MEKKKAKEEVGLGLSMLVIFIILMVTDNWLPRPIPEWIAKLFS